jgi:hypothetical protein
MSRRIKPDRRNVADPYSVVELVHVVEYPNIPVEFIRALDRLRKDLARMSWRICGEEYRDDESRRWVAWDLAEEAQNIDCMMEYYRLIPDTSPMFSEKW